MFKIPEELKPRLVDDWGLSTWRKQCLRLPAKKNVGSTREDEQITSHLEETGHEECAVNAAVAGRKEQGGVTRGTQLPTHVRPQ